MTIAGCTAGEGGGGVRRGYGALVSKHCASKPSRLPSRLPRARTASPLPTHQRTLLSQLGLALLHRRKDEVADARGGEAVEARAPESDGDDVQVLCPRVVTAVDLLRGAGGGGGRGVRGRVATTARHRTQAERRHKLTAPTGKPSEIRNFCPCAPPRPSIRAERKKPYDTRDERERAAGVGCGGGEANGRASAPMEGHQHHAPHAPHYA